MLSVPGYTSRLGGIERYTENDLYNQNSMTPPPAMNPESRHINNVEFESQDIPLREGEKPAAAPPTSSPSLFDNIRSTLATGFGKQQQDKKAFDQNNASSLYDSSPAIRSATGFHHFKDRQTSDLVTRDDLGKTTQHINGTFEFLNRPYSPHQTQERLHHAVSEVSIPDGSTVGNIYKHYLHDDALADFSDDASISDFDQSLPGMKPASPSEFRTQRQSMGASSDLLRLQKQSPISLIQHVPIRLGRNAPGDPPQLSLPAAPQRTFDAVASSRNEPMPLPNTRMRQPPTLFIDRGDGKAVAYGDSEFDNDRKTAARLPLEREVSDALRRVSGYSAYSDGSLTDSIIERYRHFGQKLRLIPSQAPDMSPGQDVDTIFPAYKSDHKPDNSADAHSGRFYNDDAIAPNWIHGDLQKVVRVPVNQSSRLPGSPSKSPPFVSDSAWKGRSLSDQKGRPSLQAADDSFNDWETIGTRTSAFVAQDQSSGYGLTGGMVGRTGSSIADTSDNGFEAALELDNLRFTDRIAQHPAHAQYQADYRQRTLKDTKAPIFAPKYRVHNVNGFLANSNRLRPQPCNISTGPPPKLSKTHSNPFLHTPPQELSIQPGSSRGPYVKSSGYMKPFKPSLQTLDTEIDEEDYTAEIVPPSSLQHLSQEERQKKTLDWMENFGEHKLTLPSPSSNQNSRPTSFYKAIQQAAVSFSSLFGENTKPPVDTKLREFKLPAKMQADGVVESRSRSGRHSTKNIKSWAKQRGSNVTLSPYHQRSKELDRNQSLRDLTLVDKLDIPSTPQSLTTMQTEDNVGSDEFLYRSPLAPPKHNNWKRLYSPSQLFGFQENAKADGFSCAAHHQRTSFISDTLPAISSRKYLYERPTLRLWKRDEATNTDLTHQKRNCSIVVLCMCTFFPPLLLVYIFGGLDGVISWWTEGHYTSFAKSQKRLALIFLVAWSVAVFIGLVVFLALWFSGLRQPQ